MTHSWRKVDLGWKYWVLEPLTQQEGKSHRCPNRNDSQVPVDVLQAVHTDTADPADFLQSTHPHHTRKSFLCLALCRYWGCFSHNPGWLFLRAWGPRNEVVSDNHFSREVQHKWLGLQTEPVSQKKISTLKETIMSTKCEQVDEVRLCYSQHWPVSQILRKSISVLPVLSTISIC